MATARALSLGDSAATRARMNTDGNGFVSHMVQAMNQRRLNAQLGAAAGDRGMSSFLGGAQHGNAEQRGQRPRQRSRDRSPGGRSASQSTMQFAVPATMEDVATQLEHIHDRLDTLERLTRLHAQTIAHADEMAVETRSAVVATDKDISMYKNHITSMHQTIDRYVTERNNALEEKINMLTAQLESMTSLVVPNFNTLDVRTKALESALGSLQLPPGIPQDVPTYGINTPPAMTHSVSDPVAVTEPERPTTPGFKRDDPFYAHQVQAEAAQARQEPPLPPIAPAGQNYPYNFPQPCAVTSVQPAPCAPAAGMTGAAASPSLPSGGTPPAAPQAAVANPAQLVQTACAGLHRVSAHGTAPDSV